VHILIAIISYLLKQGTLPEELRKGVLIINFLLILQSRF
jgi:hypothetical protein